MKVTLFMCLQHLLPQHLLSRMAGIIANSRFPLLKNFIIRRFIQAYDVNLDEAKIKTPEEYTNFNEFFCRELDSDVRPLSDKDDDIICPVDGAISQIGEINGDEIYQAKGKQFTLSALFGGNHTLANKYQGGSFATIYLSPKDYHRIHMPTSGALNRMIHVPGALFSVNKSTTENIHELFARNERLVIEFTTAFGPMVMVYVGAMIVASIETPWSGLIAPRKKQVQSFNYGENEKIQLNKGEECGRFRLGSTVILVFPKNTMQWQQGFEADKPVRKGETIACYTP